jgi:hypothetical protein
VTDEPRPELDPAGLLGVFARHGVEFVAVGGFAALRHGAHRATKDIDLCVRSGDVDVRLGIPRDARWELVRYEELRGRGVVITVGQLEIPVAAPDDIIRSKEIANRQADREALPELRRLRDEVEEDRRSRGPGD